MCLLYYSIGCSAVLGVPALRERFLNSIAPSGGVKENASLQSAHSNAGSMHRSLSKSYVPVTARSYARSKKDIEFMIQEICHAKYILHNCCKGDKVSRKSSFSPIPPQYCCKFSSIW